MTSFAVTWDYRCPFARNAHEHLLAGLAAAPTGTSPSCRSRSARCTSRKATRRIWDRPERRLAACSPSRRASSSATASPTPFLAVHRALFAARHVHAKRLDEDHRARRARGPRRRRRRGVRRDRRRCRRSTRCARSTRPPRSTTTSGASPRSSSATRPCSCASCTDSAGDGELARTHDRPHPRPADRVSRAQRVQAHLHPALTSRPAGPVGRRHLPMPARRLVA